MFENIGCVPNLVWYKSCHADINSLSTHWHKNTDTPFADSVDMASWTGHCGSSYRSMHFFEEDFSCDTLDLEDTKFGNTDANWIIFYTCYSLVGSETVLKNELVSSVSGERCAHLFLGFYSKGYFKDDGCGEYFADRLEAVSIKQAWFDYCEYKQYKNTIVRVFGAVDCMNDSVAGPGPIEISRDPTKDSEWTSDYHEKLSE